MLADAAGKVRWVGSGAPEEHEKGLFAFFANYLMHQKSSGVSGLRPKKLLAGKAAVDAGLQLAESNTDAASTSTPPVSSPPQKVPGPAHRSDHKKKH